MSQHFFCSAPSSSSSSSSPPLSPHAHEASLSLFPSLCPSLSPHHLSSLLVLDRDDSPRRGCAHHPNNEVHFFYFFLWRFLFPFSFSLALFANGGKSEPIQEVSSELLTLLPWLPVVPGRASLSQGLLGAEWASLGSSCQCWGGEGEGKKQRKSSPALRTPSSPAAPKG